MTLSFILNGEDVTVDAEPNRRLVDILRDDFGLTGCKAGCRSGHCGACAVVFNGTVSPACQIPAFNLRASEIVTIEGFAITDDYNDIMLGFSAYAVENCGFCGAAKVLLADSLIAGKELPARGEILSAFDSISCRCTTGENLADAVLEAAKIRDRRHNVRRR
ncbi:MAG: 2Fe-2S iron-sulfur cluster binding domain-containing protein [Spirochaetaceae bacterium]|jgi:carbon-monoxide dehydrogenase small subunit|nr:2Fe-2S iron-sulfur cluster binding domain-containing protein [Spirochaetaceae bacterium]